jgi:hypothetical protein
MNAERPDKGIRQRLAALVGGTDRADSIAKQYLEQLRHRRTIALGVTGPATAAADFFVLLYNSSGGFVVEGVTFIGGDETFRRFADSLRTVRYEASFPDSAPAKILRRGTLPCGAADRPGSCRFLMMLPADAQAAEQE